MNRSIQYLGLAALVLLAAVTYYGLKTDCPDTATYVNCSE